MRRRLLLWGILALIGVPAMLAVVALAAANTEWGRARIAGAVESATAAGPVRVRIGRLTGPLPVRIGVENLRLSDGTGEFARIDRAAFSWSPLALLAGTLSVDAVTVAGGRLDRLPAVADDPEAAPQPPAAVSLKFPAPPIAIRVGRMTVSDLDVAGQVAGVEARLGAALSAAVTASSATAAGWAEVRTAGGLARIDLDLAVDPDDGTLRAELRAHEPDGGMIAGLVGMPDRPSLDLSVTGAGTLADWRGRIAGGFGDGAGIDLSARVGSMAAGTRIVLDGSAAVQRFLSPDLAVLVGASNALSVAALLAPDGRVEVERASLRLAAGELEGKASIDAAGTPVAADVAIRVPELAALSGLAGTDLAGAIAARLRLLDDGRRASVDLTGSPTVASTTLDRLSVAMAAHAPAPLATVPQSVAWTVDAEVDTPTVPGFDLVTPIGGRVTARAAGTAGTDGRLARVDVLDVTTAAGTVTATAGLVDGRRVDARVTANLPDLSRFAALAGLDLEGAATLDADANVLLDPLDVSAVVDLAGLGLALGDPALQALVGAAPSLGAGVTLDDGGRLAVHGLAARIAAGQANGDATLDLEGGGIAGRIDMEVPDLAAVGAAAGVDLSGRGAVAVALGGTLSAPAASASWTLAPLAVGGTPLGEITGSAIATGLPDRPAGRLDLRAAAAGEHVTLATGYALDGDRLRLDGIALDGAGIRGRGRLAVDLAGPRVDGRITLTAEALDRLGQLAGVAVAGGALDAAVDLSAGGGQAARLTAELRDLSIGADGEATRIASVSLIGDGRSLLDRPAGSLRAEVGGVQQGERGLVETALLTATADGTAAKVALSLNGETAVPYRLTATATAALDRRPLRVSLDSLEADAADVRIALDRPARLALGRQPRLEGLALRVDGGRITGGGSLDPAQLDLAIAVRDLPAALVRLADPSTKLSGAIDADLSVKGPLRDPAARLTVSAPAVQATDPSLADLPPLVAAMDVRVQSLTLTASMEASVGQGASATLRSSIGLAAGRDGGPPTLADDAPLDVEIDVEAALDRVAAYLPLDGGRAAGQLSVHVAVQGTAAAPRVDGTAALRDGAFEYPATGLYLRDVRFQARGQGERLVVDDLAATAVGGGTLTGSGGLSFDVAEGMPAELTIAARRFAAVDTDEADIAVDADLTLDGRLPAYRLAGTITVLPSEIRIPDQLPPSVIELDVTEIRDGVVVRSPDNGKQAASEGEGGAPVVLDLTVDIPGQVFVRGRGLDSEWGGGLTIKGRADAPDVEGRIEARRGGFSGFGRNFAFERGRVVFDGGPPDDPSLDMILAAAVADIEAKVVVGGRAQDPSISLTSEPSLPEEEILSRILFGSPRAELSALQALKLAQSAAVLSGRLGSGGGITDTVREALGVDTLDVETGDDGSGSRGASLSVGKYVAPGVFLKLQQGLGGASSKAVVEVEVTDNITVETDVGADSQSRAGVNWKVDY